MTRCRAAIARTATGRYVVKLLVLNQSEVTQLMPMDECMEAMVAALEALTHGEAVNPLRQVLWLPDTRGAFAAMPAIIPGIKSMGVKVISVFPGNQGTEFESHQGVVLLFETGHGRPLALIDATSITAIRT